MATENPASSVGQTDQVEVESTVRSIKKMLKVGAIFVAFGYLLLLFSLTQEFSTLSAIFAEDSMKMWLKLGGVGHILVGIFIALAGILRALSLMPHRLGQELAD